jgi:hypothetical protein
MERAFGAIKAAVPVQARPQRREGRLERSGDALERRRVSGLVGAHLRDLRAGKVAAWRAGEGHHLQHAGVRPQHGAQRHAKSGLARGIEALLAPANLNQASLAKLEPGQPLHQLGALDNDARMPGVAHDIQRARRLARRMRTRREQEHEPGEGKPGQKAIDAQATPSSGKRSSGS